MNKELTERIKRWRLAMGVNQSEAAEALGIAQGAYSRIETGKRMMKLPEAIKLSQRLGVDLTMMVTKNPADVFADKS